MEIRTEQVKLAAAEGEMPCHLARPAAAGRYPAVIVVMEAFGLTGHIRDVAGRIAHAGYVALAPDLYYRFGSPVVAYADVPKAIEWMRQLDPARVMGDVGAAIAGLGSRPEVRGDRIGIVGFCMGGTVAFRAAAHHASRLAAAVSFYGGGSLGGDAPLLARIGVPVLALWGERDDLIPLAQVRRVEETMRGLGKVFASKTYGGAGHGFFCDERASYHPASATDAWSELIQWFAKYLKEGKISHAD